MKVDFRSIGEQFSNLDPDNIGNWPILVRSMIVLLVCAAVLGGGYYFDTQHQQVELERVVAEEEGLWSTIEKKQLKAANLADYKAQMIEMEESFGTMLRQLPSKNEVADLLVDVTQTGLASGLEFELFKPNNEQPKEFYAVLPITVNVNGHYHNLGQFVSGVAALPRIVTIHDIQLKVTDPETRRLTMTATAKTYRYLDDDEIAAGKPKAKAGKKGKK
ncbi:MAG: type 4a pilus biogenesis protein PilO [Gammaproteobacteria bacterium]|nr:type 4a pilus biogenesis protein PilO [Gammaproteobacteria bacterium]